MLKTAQEAEPEYCPMSKAAKERRIRYIKHTIAAMKDLLVDLEKELQYLEQDKPVKKRQPKENPYTALLRKK